MSETDFFEAASSYGAVRGSHIFENELKNRSDGVAIVEFSDSVGAAAAVYDRGKAWSSKQNDRTLDLSQGSEAVVAALIDLGAQSGGHWSRAAFISKKVVDAVYGVLSRELPYGGIDNNGKGTLVIRKSCTEPTLPPQNILSGELDKHGLGVLPSAIVKLLEKIKAEPIAEKPREEEPKIDE